MTLDPRTPVLVGTAQRNGTDEPSEPVTMMAACAVSAFADAGAPGLAERVQTVRVVKGVNPYADPARLVAAELGLTGVETATTQLGGNEAFDLVGRTAAEIAAGSLDVALLCSAETIRTRRRDRAAGRDSTYRSEATDAAPDRSLGAETDLADQHDVAAHVDLAVNFYATAEVAIRHRAGESPDDHRARIASLWAQASEVAADNPHAWIRRPYSAAEISEVGSSNRMVAYPYPKLMTSNIDVDQAAAHVLCSVAAAEAAGVPRDRWVFVHAAASAHDHWVSRSRWALDESPAMRLSARALLQHAGMSIGEVDMVDLYSCFPSAVQVGQRELDVGPDVPFTITGGMTFAGGPLNSYCMHSLGRAVELLRERPDETALLSGNGGYFTKHSFLLLGGAPPSVPFDYLSPQPDVDRLPQRPVAATLTGPGEIEAYTVAFDRRGESERAILSVLDRAGARTWAHSTDRATISELLATDACGRTVDSVAPDDPVCTVRLT